MATCVATVISPVSGHCSPERFHGDSKIVSNNLEPFSVQSGLDEEILNAYMMAAVEAAAAQVPTEPRLQTCAETIQKGLREPQEIIADSEIESLHPPKVTIADDFSTERNDRDVNETSSELDNLFEIIPERKIDETVEDAKDVKEIAEEVAVVSNEYAVAMKSEGVEVTADSNNLPFTAAIPANVVASDHEEPAVAEDSNLPEVKEVVVVNGTDKTQFGTIIFNDSKARLESTDCNGSTSEFADQSLNESVHTAANVEAQGTETVSATQAAHIDNANETKVSRTFSFTGLNHVAFCVENLERSLEFYCGLLGLRTNLDRPNLPYRGAWLLLGTEGIHIMEVPNPDPVHGRPNHGGYDRHACLNCRNVEGVRLALEKAGIPYQPSIVPSVFARDPDGNGLEFIEFGA